ncbi:MAG: hypothetical protein AAFZ38_09705, partial [Myxococcota bacterium]
SMVDPTGEVAEWVVAGLISAAVSTSITYAASDGEAGGFQLALAGTFGFLGGAGGQLSGLGFGSSGALVATKGFETSVLGINVSLSAAGAATVGNGLVGGVFGAVGSHFAYPGVEGLANSWAGRSGGGGGGTVADEPHERRRRRVAAANTDFDSIQRVHERQHGRTQVNGAPIRAALVELIAPDELDLALIGTGIGAGGFPGGAAAGAFVFGRRSLRAGRVFLQVVKRVPRLTSAFPRRSLQGVSLKWLKRNKPSGWTTLPTRGNKGFIWRDQNGVERLRFMRPNGRNAANSQWSRQANGYFRWQDESGNFLDASGNVVPSSHPNFQELTHIIYEGPL